ncbi:MAG TPA: response regulator [Candidatus Thermoplasmatota archaeon]|nr:response regulator [Candidatus Thermoplasmatota archaeon]
MKPRVLVVEDEGLIAQDLAHTLTRIGYEVTGIVDTGPDAIAAATENKPDVILMDIRLKGPMDGIEAAGEIHRGHDVPVVFLTAHSDAATLERAKLARPYGYVLKPFEEVDLKTTLEIARNIHHAEVALARAEERHRAILATLDEAVIGIDADGRVTFLNPAARSLTARSDAEAIGRDLAEVVALSLGNSSLDLVLAQARRKRESRTFEARLTGADGARHDVRGALLPMRDGYVITLRDTLDRANYERLIRERDVKIAALEKRVEELI